LDLGCGTGLVGEYLAKIGYTNIDGVDASEGMIRLANAKNVYN
jgi:predicted TPR repeat methyltransferase